MPDTKAEVERRAVRVTEATAAPDPQLAAGATADQPLPLARALSADARLTGRANHSMRAAVVQRMQQAYGNRSVRRFLQRQAAPPAAAPDTAPAAPATPANAPADDAAIDALDLADTAKAAAKALKALHPEITFTSGRRDVASQAHAMASNIVSSGNRNWIADTYASAATLQKWVDDHPKATTVAAIAAGLEETMNAMSDSERGKISKHLSGEAFDVQPQTKDADKIKADIKALSGLTKFLEKEGGLVRWHAQF